jgi:predicted outer membrane repeat protein
VTLDRVLFNRNQSQNNRGGAVYVEGADLTIRNSTFTANSAQSGGAVALVNPVSHAISINNATLRADMAVIAATELYTSGTMTPSAIEITNTLISGNCSGFGGAPTAHNSIESPGNTCALNVATNRVSVPDSSINLIALSDNGGPTQTMQPSTGSEMIDAGGNDCESVDQRDLVRNVGVCDVGAFEVGASLVDAIFSNGF